MLFFLRLPQLPHFCPVPMRFSFPALSQDNGTSLIDSVCIGFRGEYRVVYVTPEFIEADGCELLKQLHNRVGMLAVTDIFHYSSPMLLITSMVML